ncbi:O-antigen translocase [Kluyvera ascorbata]|uniref:O-antigen translocase n=1 Tax=Kluyvera ascorbata TaxID=51288 RepID=UPI0039F59B4A
MKRLFKVTVMTGALTLLRMMFGFAISKVVAIYAGPTGLAMLGQLQNMVTSLNGIIASPTGSGVVKYTAEHHSKGYLFVSSWWRASIYWMIILSGIIIPLGIIFSNYISVLLFDKNDWAWVITVSMILLPISALGTLCNSILNGCQAYKRFIITGGIATIISGSIMLVLIIMGNLRGALLAVALQSSLIGFASILCNYRQPWLRFEYFFGKIETSHKRDMAAYILMAFVSAVTMPVSLIIVRNMLVSHVGWTEAGHWQAVWKISEVYISVITMALGTYYLPRLASLKTVNDILNEIHNTAKIVLPLIIVMAIGIYILRDIALMLLFTKQFYSARDLFSIQLIGDVVKIAGWLYAYPMLARRATKWFITTEILFSLFFVGASFIFIRMFGVHGANLGYLLAYLLYFIVVFTNVKRFAQ